MEMTTSASTRDHKRNATAGGDGIHLAVSLGLHEGMAGDIIEPEGELQRPEVLRFDPEQQRPNPEGENLLKLQSRQAVVSKPLNCYSPKVQILLASF